MLWTSQTLTVIYSIIFSLSSASGYTEEAPPSAAVIQNASQTVLLGSLIRETIENNPDIQAARHAWAQEVERYPLQTALDDPMVMFTYDLEEMEQKEAIEWTQTFPFPGTLRQRGRVVEKEIEIAQLNYERVIRDVIADLKSAVYELIYLDGAIGITQQTQDLLDQILSYARTRYTSKETGINDVFRAEAQRAQLDYDLITQRELREIQVSVINAILNRSVKQKMDEIAAAAPPEETPPLEQLDELVQDYGQEARLAQLGVARAHEMTRLAHRENLPMFNLSAMYMKMPPEEMNEEPEAVIVGAGMTIPFWFHKNKARVRYAEEEKKRMEQEKKSTLNNNQVQVRRAYFQVENARRLVVLYRDQLLPQAEHAVQIAEQWNQNQMSSVSEILETQNVWLNFNLAYLRARADHAQAVTRLEQIVGGSLHPQKKEDGK